MYRAIRGTSQLRYAAAFAAVAMLAAGLPSAAYAKYSPEHPEVKALVKRGLSYLAGKTHNEVGGKALIGLAFLKGQDNKNHPKIAEGVSAVRGMINAPTLEIHADGPVYTIGVSVIFLCELDAQRYRPEIQKMLDWLLTNQKPHGGWGYPHRDTGDTSMTQYGVLSMWTARQKGFEVPDENIARVTNWLIRTQDPSGGWGYQGVDPGSFTRVPQSPVSHSLTAAGTGSLYICGDLLGIKEKREVADSGLPPGLQRVEKKEDPVRRPSNMVDPGRLNSGVGGGNNWFAKNGGISADMPWVYYYMYALERYMSFYEYARFGKHQENAAWYDMGVEFLKEKITDENAWIAESGPEAGTCFGVLFLVRSTRTTMEKAQKPLGGELAGGKGLKGALETARVANGKVVTEDDKRASALDDIDDLVAQLGNQNFDATIDLPPKVELPDDSSERERQLKKLRALVSAERFEARMLAVRTLVGERSLDNAPVLIYALTDPDNRVAIEARDGLRSLSRRFSGFGMPDEPTDAQKATAARSWRDWYYSLRPEAEETEEIVLP